jgi:hypothetical protein
VVQTHLQSTGDYSAQTYAEAQQGNTHSVIGTFEDPVFDTLLVAGAWKVLPALGQSLIPLHATCLANPVCAAIGLGVAGEAAEQQLKTPSNQIRFTQDSIGPNTKAGVPLDTLTQEIDSGYFQGTLRVVKTGGKFYSLDNRRLAAFKLLDRDVPVTVVDLNVPKVLQEFFRKFTTLNDGLSITVRGTDLIIK